MYDDITGSVSSSGSSSGSGSSRSWSTLRVQALHLGQDSSSLRRRLQLKTSRISQQAAKRQYSDPSLLGPSLGDTAPRRGRFAQHAQQVLQSPEIDV